MTKMIPITELNNDDAYLRVDSSIDDLKAFIDSTVHKDFQREMMIRINSLGALIDDFDMQYTGRQCDSFRGGKRAYMDVLNIFTDILMGLESDVNNKLNKE